ncbi:phosphoribosylaminoimidazolecarboxamide formyltransferase/IMP cyclohydrolase [Nakamurella sp. UYEF19]|uniref:bifunctional phosphoribosylaminoimidazolecarboxamide formyltransferase/IMP cyclohydrolase n=1 Tax=Nakamurella sp. UYEF19 TaxID=1756392 RepID=UPI00339382D1
MSQSSPQAIASSDGRRRIGRALLSVSDKDGLLELATALADAGVALVSTGGSAKMLADVGLPVSRVEEVTGFPECLDGRVKTLHPKIHGGLLADTRKQSHLDQLEDLGIETFDLVVVNLYPFRRTVAAGSPVDDCIEQIDIGGPAMIRASAKNHPSVTTVVEPADYPAVIAALQDGGFTLKHRQTFAAKAFAHTASYDVAVASWMNAVVAPDEDGWPRWTGSTWERQSVLRYGENPHQKAALYRHWRQGLAGAQQLHGKEMSYNNYVDVDAAWRAAKDFSDPAVAIIKHANPCGIAVVSGGSDEQIAEAHVKALACDPVSAFGGVIAVNRRVTLTMAEQVAEVFTEVLLAPGFDEAALEVLTRKKNIRLLVMPAEVEIDPVEFRGISGGILAQTRDEVDAPGDDPSTWTLAAGPAVDAATLADLDFAWRSCRAVKSNAILLAAGGASVGIGMGQVNRVDSCRLAVERAGDRAAGSVAASDAYFPFADGPQILFDAGVKAIVQPGGSMRDPETVAAAEKAGVTMYFTGTRHFFH